MSRPKPGLLFLLIILGALVILQLRIAQSGIKYVRIQDLYLLKNEIKADKAEIEQLKKNIQLKNQELIKYSSGDDSQKVEALLSEERLNLKAILGLTPLEGPGVIILITDSNRELLEDEDPNNLMVHDYDMQRIVDDLLAAGAEAISINDERIFTTKMDIVCNGPTIRINQRRIAQPFIIKAIGNKEHLESAITAPGRYGNLLKEWGLFVEVNPSVNVQIPPYLGSIKNANLIPVEEKNSP